MPDTPPPPSTPKSYPEQRRRVVEQERRLTEGGRHVAVGEADTTEHHLRKLAREHQRFLNLHSPFKASLWLALLRPTGDVIADARRELAAESSDDPTEPRASRPAIVVLGEVAVAKALLGDVSAISIIAERIEGKVGSRKGDHDDDELRVQRQVSTTLAKVVELMTLNKHGKSIPEHLTDVLDDEPT